MKKRLLSILLTACMVLTLLPTAALAASTAWNGTTNTSWYNGSQTSFTLTTAEQLAGLAVLVNGGNNFSGKTINLGADINLGSINWTPIGTWDSSSSFKGNFDGKGFAVRNLKIDTGSAYSGLFGSVISGGTVKNLALIDSNIVCGSRSGTFIGLNFGTIQNCYSNGYISAGGSNNEAVGGIVGSNDSGGIIENCYFSGARVYSWATSGQITGYCYTSGNVRNCYFDWYSNGALGSYVTADQMKGLKGATNSGWSDITISGVNKGKLSLVDALNQWVSAQTPGSFTPWYCSSADGDVYPGFVKEEFIVSISDGTGVGTIRTTASASLAGAITSGTTYVAPGETVTITAGVPDSAYKAGTVSVYKTGYSATTIGVTLISAGVYQFTMPRYPVTIANSYAPKSELNDITAFSFANPAVSGTVNSSDHTVTVIVPYGTNVSSLSPSITVSPAATINPISGAAQNFSEDVTYTVTAENGSTQSWTITVLIRTATPAGIGFNAATSMLTGISDGMEYSVNGGSTWVTITGSEGGKAAISGVTAAKGIQVRNNGAAPHTAPSDASTINITQAAPPSAPSISAVTANSVTLTPVAGNEYSKDGSTWQTSNLFDNLSPATGYTFYQRVAASGTTLASLKSTGQAQHTAAAKPSAGVGYSINYATEKITITGGYEINTDAGFGAGTAVLDNAVLTPGTTYYVRVAANGGVPASEAVSFAIPARSAAPASILAANITKTGTAITITNTVAGQEYQVNGTWYTPVSGKVTATGLAAGTDYSILTRVKATENSFASLSSAALTVKTKTAPATAPAAPTIGTGADKPTSGSITVSTAAGNEYYISTSATADWSGTPNGYFKETVSGTHKFDGLTPATQYYIHVRIAETDNAMPSASAYVTQYTLPATPVASVVTVNYASETISFTNTYEVSTSAGFTTTIANGGSLQPGTTYYVRVKSASGAPASEAVSFTIPARPAAPTVITADKTKNSITITPVGTQEYKIDSGAWQDSGSFTGLNPNTSYAVYARVKATGTAFASAEYSMSVTTKSVGNVTVPTLAAVTYDPNKKLADTTLPANWAWSVPATVPTVAINSYSAVYTPTDTAMVDYSGEAGYAVDGSGKVTITRTVPLTVNRATPTAADFTFTAPASLNYSGTAKTAAVAVKGSISGMGAITVKYYLGGVETVPTNYGTYTVKIDLAQGNNYAAATAVTDSAWTFTIAKVAQAPLSITGKPASVTYGDTFTLATAGGSGTGAVTWAVTSGSSATVNANTGVVTITGVGETTITASKAADGNYTDAVTDTYTFTPAKRLITVNAPSATGGWTKTYDGKTDFDKSIITVGGITNKVGSDAVNVSVQSVAYDTAAIGSGDKTLTITYAMDGTNSGNYLAPNNAVISTASITAATPTITLKSKTEAYTDKKIEIDAATVKGVTGGTTPDGAITYTYYTKDTCTDADKTSVDKSGAEAVGGAPKTAGTYYVKATIAASGNYGAATSAAVTLTIYYPSSGADQSSAPVIVDGKTVDIGTSEVKDGTTTVKVDQNKMSEQLKSAEDSVVIPVASKTDTAAAQLVVQNVEDMAKKGMTLTVQAEGVNYNLPAAAVDTAALLKGLDASDSSKVTFTVTMAELSKTAVTIKDGTLMVAPMQFTVTAAYNGKSVNVENFESYVQRDIELPSGVDPKTITTAVVVEANGTERHVPTEVYSKGGKWYAKINSMTNSTYALIQNSVSFTDTTGKWYADVVTEMASRKVISGIGENMFAGERAITRAEFAAILVRSLGLPANGTSAFSDVSTSAWYSGAVATAAQYGLVTGKGDNRFIPDAYITRQEAMTMLQRAAKLTNYSGTAGSLEGFTDAGSVGTWAQDAAKWNVGSGLVVGSGGLLRPNDNISRAESATVILRLLQKTGLVDVRSKA